MYDHQWIEQLGQASWRCEFHHPVDNPYIRNPEPYIRNLEPYIRNLEPYIRNLEPYIRNRTNLQAIDFLLKNASFLV